VRTEGKKQARVFLLDAESGRVLIGMMYPNRCCLRHAFFTALISDFFIYFFKEFLV